MSFSTAITRLPKVIQLKVLNYVFVKVGMRYSRNKRNEIICRMCMSRGVEHCRMSHIDIVNVHMMYMNEIQQDLIYGARPVGSVRMGYINAILMIDARIQKLTRTGDRRKQLTQLQNEKEHVSAMYAQWTKREQDYYVESCTNQWSELMFRVMMAKGNPKLTQ